MNDLISASFEGIIVLSLDKRDKGSVTDFQRYNTFQGWWFSPCKWSEKAEGDSEGRMVEHGVHVTLRVGGGTGTSRGSNLEIYAVTSVFSKA